MILRSLQVEGWRCFANPVDLTGFVDGVNVIHAPNATGKSTLFEALQRGLLDGHRVTGDAIDAIRPWGRDLSPCVCIEFQHEGMDYRLEKQFLRSRSASLSVNEGGTFVRLAEGDAATERTRSILWATAPGRGVTGPKHWGLAQVLWVPQDELALTELSGDMSSRIQGALGAEVVGPESGGLEKKIQQAYDAVFTSGGAYRTGKDAPHVSRVKQALDAVQDELPQAKEKVLQFDEFSRRVEDQRARRAQAQQNESALSARLNQAREGAASYNRLVAECQTQKARVGEAELKHQDLHSRIRAMQKAKSGRVESNRQLERLQKEAAALQAEVGTLRRDAESKRTALAASRRNLAQVQQDGRTADVARRYVEARTTLLQLEKFLRNVQTVKEEHAAAVRRRNQVVAPNKKDLAKIRSAIRKRDEARVKLDAALITLEVVAEHNGTMEVLQAESTGSQELMAEVPVEIKGAPEVAIHFPGIARIRARGPAGTIEDLREAVVKADRMVDAQTSAYGSSELEQLETLRTKAADLDNRKNQAESALDGLLAGKTIEDIEQSKARASQEAETLAKEHPEWRDSLPDHEGLRAAADTGERTCQTIVNEAEQSSELAVSALNDTYQRQRNHAKDMETRQGKCLEFQAVLEELRADGRSDPQRDDALNKLALEWRAARGQLHHVEEQLAGYAEDPNPEVDALEAQLRTVRKQADDALAAEKKAEGELQTLAAQSPYSARVALEERIADLEEQYTREHLRVRAIRLLRDTLAECRATAVDAVLGPAEASATRLLKRMAGPRLGEVKLAENLLPERVAPPVAGQEIFASWRNLSGGEKEQLHLAVRLALAEALYTGEREMIVLDDVLTATDTARLARVQILLEEAAQKFQLILLTCHPERYSRMTAARFFDLESLR